MAQFFNQMFQRILLQPLEQWMENHPLLNWLILHPSILVVVVIVLVLLLAGFLGAIARATENLWIRVLRIPFQLLWTLLRGTIHVTKLAVVRSPTPALAELPEAQELGRSPQQELDHLLTRLETIKQEEAELIQQIKTIIQQQLSSHSQHP